MAQFEQSEESRRARYIAMIRRMILSGEVELSKCRTVKDQRYVEASLAHLRADLDRAQTA